MTNFACLFLIETSAIAETDLHTWQAIAKLGECLLPELVAIEIKNIADGKIEGNESSAKQFQNLLPNLNWQITNLTAKHPDLLIKSTQNLSRKAKLMVSIAQNAIGVANAHPDQCVVLISDEISLRDRIAVLKYQNICAIPSAIARQWSRTDHRPPIVETTIKNLAVKIDQSTQIDLQSANKIVNPSFQDSGRSAKKIKSSGRGDRQIVVSFLKFTLTTTFLVTISLLGWWAVQPQQFQSFWEKSGLPQILPSSKPIKK
jgi:hypothetical protein